MIKLTTNTELCAGWLYKIERVLYRGIELLLLCCILLLSMTGSIIASTTKEILLIKSGTDDIYNQVIDSFNTNLQKQCRLQRNQCSPLNLRTITIDESATPHLNADISAPRTLIITVGSRAAKFVAAHETNAPVLHTLIPRQIFSSLASHGVSGKTSAIYIDQPIKRQLRLISESMPTRKQVGILLSDNSIYIKSEIIKLADKYGLKPQFSIVRSEHEIGSLLSALMLNSDVLLALPDKLVFNRHTAHNILLSSYHKQIPVVGFSRAYVNAGAITAVFSSPEDIGMHMGDTVSSFLGASLQTLPEPTHPKYYSVQHNRHVARALQIQLPPADHLNHSSGIE